MRTSNFKVPSSILHTLVWLLSAFIILTFAFGQFSCHSVSDCNEENQRFIISSILGYLGLFFGLLAVISGWIGWRITKFLLWLITAGWLAFFVLVWRSVGLDAVWFQGIPTLTYLALAFWWSTPKMQNQTILKPSTDLE